MRKRYLVLILTSLFSSIICYINNEEVFLNANKFFHEQQFQEALELYDSLPRHGWAVYCNKACCFFQLGNYVQAMLYWQRALKNGGHSYSAIIEEYCLRASQQLNTQYKGLNWKDSCYFASKKIPLGFWQILFLSMLYALFLCYLLSPKKFTWIIYFLLVSTVLLLGILLFRYQMTDKQRVIVLEPSALYAGTDTSFSKVIDVPRGLILSAIQRHEEWAKVDCQGKVGWINIDTVEFI